MEINERDLVDLLEGEIYSAWQDLGNSGRAKLNWGIYQGASLEWVEGQTFFIADSNNDEMFPGATINVDEILDIVL